MMSVKNQTPSLCNIYSFHEDLPEEFVDQTDVNKYFHPKILDLSQSQLRKVRVSRGSNKKSFAIKLFQFCELKTQQRYILQEKVNISKRKLTYFVKSLRDLLKTFDHVSKCIQIPLQKPKKRLDLQSQKTISLFFTITISLNIQLDKFSYRSALETTTLAYFPSKTLNYTAINLLLHKLSTSTIEKFTISTRTNFEGNYDMYRSHPCLWV